jgi:sarcosine oxidase subunit gamma
VSAVTAIQQSAVADLEDAMRAASAATGGAVELRERPFLAHFDVRGDAAAIGVAVPVEPNTWIAGWPSVLWLGPDEWLVVGEPGSQAALEAALTGALAVTDVSDQRTVLELSGPAARDVLATGCALDLHPRAFAPGDCAQTLLGRAGVILAQRDETPAYWIFARRSFAAYMVSWLLDAMTEHTG